MEDADDKKPPPPPPPSPTLGSYRKARDIFTSAENVIPVPFSGTRLHFLLKAGESGTFATATARGLQTVDKRGWWWSAASIFKLSVNGPKPGPLWVSTAYNVGTPIGRASVTSGLNPTLGDWTFEAVVQAIGERLDASVAGQVSAWNEPATVRVDVDCKCSDGMMSLCVDPMLKKCAFQCLQAFSCRLSIGAELAFEKCMRVHVDKCSPSSVKTVEDAVCQPAVMVTYAGSRYLISGKANPVEGSAKLAYYRHVNDTLQIGATATVNPIRSSAITRLAFRVVSDTSAFRAAIGTDGVVSSVWEKRLGDRLSMSVSAFLNHSISVHGMGIGLSFE